jgi:hypothetical protein
MGKFRRGHDKNERMGGFNRSRGDRRFKHSKGESKMARRYAKSASKDVKGAMHKRKRGTLKSGSGRKVKSRKQAIAIGLSEARRKGKKVPAKKKKRA